MGAFVAELIGTMILILLGNGVVANSLLDETKGKDTGFLFINIGWGIAVFAGVLVAAPFSGAHLNPAVSIGLAVAGKFSWDLVPSYILAQMIGACLGATLVWISYYHHYIQTKDGDIKLFTFCNKPAIRTPLMNMLTELIATFVLVYTVLFIAGPTLVATGVQDAKIGLGTLGALPVALLVIGIGASLGGPTGYAINPARDLGPRIMHALLPMGSKGSTDWGYAWIPVVGPILGAVVAAGLFLSFV